MSKSQHKYIAKWHLFQSLFMKVRSSDVEECQDTAPSTENLILKEKDVGMCNFFIRCSKDGV